MARYNLNEQKRWTCAFIGYVTKNAKNNFASTGDQASQIRPIIDQSIIQPNTIKQRDEILFPHMSYWKCFVLNKTT